MLNVPAPVACPDLFTVSAQSGFRDDAGERHCAYSKSERMSTLAGSAPRLVASVAGSVGLGHFLTMKGQSGNRYIFRSIHPEQAVLYNDALFAVTDHSNAVLELCARPTSDLKPGHKLHVHLLGDEKNNVEIVTSDIMGSGQ